MPQAEAAAVDAAAFDTQPALALFGDRARISAEAGGESEVDAASALAALARGPHLLCHAAYVVGRLAFAAESVRHLERPAREQRHFDVAELFAFVRPARFVLPNPAGLARVLGLAIAGAEAGVLRHAASALLGELASPNYPHPRETAEIASFLARANWPWAAAVLEALGRGREMPELSPFATGLNVWDRLPEWEDPGPKSPASCHPVHPIEALAGLDSLIGSDAERRTSQREYCAEATHAFAPRDRRAAGHVVLAEAGTGLGKTLGYLSPASLWARRNGATVWISTYTKNLQRQLEQETARIFPDPAERRHKVVVRKGRENYVCLLNLQERLGQFSPRSGRGALFSALVARWARASRDGDMVGGDFPAWLLSLFAAGGERDPRSLTPGGLGLTDRRGECIYSACPHYRRCFIERSVRMARRAELVVANHALVLHQAAMDRLLGEPESADQQEAAGGLRRIVFDEGHHVFDAADSAFSGHLTGLETAELRRWIRGPEARGRRGRSLEQRIGDLVAEDAEARALLETIGEAALALPAPGWLRRLWANAAEGPAERFLAGVREQVLARNAADPLHALETDCRPLAAGIAGAADELARVFRTLQSPMISLSRALKAKLAAEARELDTAERARIEAVARSLAWRGEALLGGFIDMLRGLGDDPQAEFIEWFAISTEFGREADVGLHRHWIDPTVPFARTVLEAADGAMITSATLKDRPPDLPDDWRNAEMRTGAVHLPFPVRRTSHASPFDYPRQSRVVVVTDVDRQDTDQVAAAYRELILAAGGGALGLFTAISRLKAVHRRLAPALGSRGLPLYAQHVDPIDIGTLIDMFRAEKDACLLGTDAVRDGVDVPGPSLRLIVMDRVPWPQPTILERARRKAFGGSAYTDMIVRLKLRQAFGRLIRSASDRGVFAILDSRLASRFCTALPEGVAVQRLGLVEAIETIEAFFRLAPLREGLAADR